MFLIGCCFQSLFLFHMQKVSDAKGFPALQIIFAAFAPWGMAILLTGLDAE
jgi:hypothetical protein